MEQATDPQLSGSTKEEEPDTFRDTGVRYLGYANELGESFKNVISKNVYRASYGVAISYVLADAIEKGWKERQRQLTEVLRPSDKNPPSSSDKTPPSNSDKAPSSNSDMRTGSSLGEGQKAAVADGEVDMWRPLAAAVDALLWHGMATVAIPGFTINRAVWLTTRIIDSLEKRRLSKVASGKSKSVSPKAPAALRRWVPAAVGLSLIPLIVGPVDESMDHLMDIAVRPYLGTEKPQSMTS